MGARYVWAAIALAAGLNAQAAKALDTSGDNAIAAPTENIRRSPDNAVYRNNRGLAYLQKDDYDRAIADFNEAIRLWPMKSAAAFNNRAMAFSGKGQHDRAIADFNRSIQIDPQNAWTYNSRGTAFKAKGDARRALADYSEAIRLSPRYVIAYQNRAAVLLSMGERSRALADLTRGRAPAAGASEQPILPQGTAGGRGWGFHQSVIGGASDSILSARSSTAHRDHDTGNNADANLAAFCQRCHMNHDRPEHRRRRWTTLFRRRAMGDLFRGPYASLQTDLPKPHRSIRDGVPHGREEQR